MQQRSLWSHTVIRQRSILGLQMYTLHSEQRYPQNALTCGSGPVESKIQQIYSYLLENLFAYTDTITPLC